MLLEPVLMGTEVGEVGEKIGVNPGGGGNGFKGDPSRLGMGRMMLPPDVDLLRLVVLFSCLGKTKSHGDPKAPETQKKNVTHFFENKTGQILFFREIATDKKGL